MTEYTLNLTMNNMFDTHNYTLVEGDLFTLISNQSLSSDDSYIITGIVSNSSMEYLSFYKDGEDEIIDDYVLTGNLYRQAVDGYTSLWSLNSISLKTGNYEFTIGIYDNGSIIRFNSLTLEVKHTSNWWKNGKLYVNDGSKWKDGKLYVNDGSKWKEASDIYILTNKE